MSDIAYSLLVVSLESLVYQHLYNHKLCLCAENPVILDKPTKLKQLQDTSTNPTNHQNNSEFKQLSKSQPISLNENLSKNSTNSSNTRKNSDNKVSPPPKIKSKTKSDIEDKDQKVNDSIKPSKAISSISMPVKRSRSTNNEEKSNDDSPTKRKTKIPNSSLSAGQENSATNLKESYSKISDISMQFQQEKGIENVPEIPQEKINKPAQLANIRELRPFTSYVLRKVKGVVSLRKAFKVKSMEKNTLRPPYTDSEVFQEFQALNPIDNDSVQDSNVC